MTLSVLDSTGTGSWDEILERNPWLATTNLVAKPDLIKHCGHGKAIAVENKSFDEAKKWVMDKMCEEKMNFLIEPFVAHTQEQEHYICMKCCTCHAKSS